VLSLVLPPPPLPPLLLVLPALPRAMLLVSPSMGTSTGSASCVSRRRTTAAAALQRDLLIGLRKLLEHPLRVSCLGGGTTLRQLLGCCPVGVTAVGVPPQRLLPECLLQLLVRASSPHAQHAVWVTGVVVARQLPPWLGVHHRLAPRITRGRGSISTAGATDATDAAASWHRHSQSVHATQPAYGTQPAQHLGRLSGGAAVAWPWPTCRVPRRRQLLAV
jgi:hypothetical protein